MVICTLVGFWAGGVVLRLLWFWLRFDLFVGFADLCAGGLSVGCGWLCCVAFWLCCLSYGRCVLLVD